MEMHPNHILELIRIQEDLRREAYQAGWKDGDKAGYERGLREGQGIADEVIRDAKDILKEVGNDRKTD